MVIYLFLSLVMPKPCRVLYRNLHQGKESIIFFFWRIVNAHILQGLFHKSRIRTPHVGNVSYIIQISRKEIASTAPLPLTIEPVLYSASRYWGVLNHSPYSPDRVNSLLWIIEEAPGWKMIGKRHWSSGSRHMLPSGVWRVVFLCSYKLRLICFPAIHMKDKSLRPTKADVENFIGISWCAAKTDPR